MRSAKLCRQKFRIELFILHVLHKFGEFSAFLQTCVEVILIIISFILRRHVVHAMSLELQELLSDCGKPVYFADVQELCEIRKERKHFLVQSW